MSLPENWKEVNPELIPAICRELMDRKDKQSAAVRICRLLCDLPDKIFLNINPLVFVESILPLVEWIFNELLDKPYLQSVVHRHRLYFMPDAVLANITWKEFILLDQQYSKVVINKSVDDLNQLVATMLREGCFDQEQTNIQNDERVPLTEWSRKQRAIEFSALKDDVKFYVLYFYMSCKETIHKKYKSAWGSSNSKEKLPAKAAQDDWETITMDIAETGVFGSLASVEQTNAHTILKWLAVKSKRHQETTTISIQDQILANHNKIAHANS